MLEAASRLNEAVAAAEHELAACTDRIINLQSELKALNREEQDPQERLARAEEVAKEGEGALSRLFAASGLKDIIGKAIPPQATEAVRRVQRIEEIGVELEQLELAEELLYRALEAPSMFCMPRRANADAALVAAPIEEVEAAYTEAVASIPKAASTSKRVRLA